MGPTTRIAASPSVSRRRRFCGGASLQQSLATLKRATGARITASRRMLTTRSSSAQEAKEERTQQLAVTLLGWAALGVRMALHKLHRGQTVPWIGVEFNILPSGLQISFDKTRTTKLPYILSKKC